MRILKKVFPYVAGGITTVATIFGGAGCKGNEPVDPNQKKLDDAKKQYALMSDSCLNYFVPKCFVLNIGGDYYYENIYNLNLGRDGPIKSAVTTSNTLEASQAWTNGYIPDDHKTPIKGASRTGAAALDAENTINIISAQMSVKGSM